MNIRQLEIFFFTTFPIDSMQKNLQFLVPESKIGTKRPTPSRVNNMLNRSYMQLKKYIYKWLYHVRFVFFESKTCERIQWHGKKCLNRFGTPFYRQMLKRHPGPQKKPVIFLTGTRGLKVKKRFQRTFLCTIEYF